MPAAASVYETLLVRRDEAVAVVTMNRPERRNALSPELDAELRAVMTALAGDDGVRAVVLTGAGKGFCAGADLAAFAGRPTPEQVYEHLTTRYGPLVESITTMEKPVLAAVNGVAAGAGASLALACDLRVMAEDASLMQAFSNLGLVPDAGSTWLMARQIGYSRAFELAAEAAPLPAHRCLELGLANRLAPPERLLEDTLAWAHRLAARPTLALGLTKHALHAAQTSSLMEAVEMEARLQKRCVASHDHGEGLASFMERRPPRFEGR